LLVLAVPIIDTSFVVAKRLKYGQPVYGADRSHLHHRFMNIGFSQARAALTMWAWCGILAGAALAPRFLRPHAHGVWHTAPTIAMAAIGALALAASIYMVYLLEIVKLANPRIRRREQEAQVRNASRRWAYPGARGIEWPARGSTARSAPSRSSSTSQTASNAALWPPDTTSFGNGAAATSSSG